MKGEHPVTFGDATYCENMSKHFPKETVLTHPEDWCTMQRLDYIFLIEPIAVSETGMITARRKKKVRSTFLKFVQQLALIEKCHHTTTVHGGAEPQNRSRTLRCGTETVQAVVPSLWSQN